MLGFIGGTGPEGRGLALRFALAGEQVLIGSREERRAREAVESMEGLVPPGSMRGALNHDVAREAGTVFVTVPYAAHRETLSCLRWELAGKTVVDVVVPSVFSKGHATAIAVEEGSAALQAQVALRESSVVSAFHTISAVDLLVPGKSIDSDVVVCADDEPAKDLVMRLAERIPGVRAVDGGGLENARYVENFTVLLLDINRIYGARSVIKIVGI